VHHAGHVVEKDELIRLVWPDTNVIEDNLTQQISNLRKALGDHSQEPTYILTIPRRGYLFVADVRTLTDEPSEKPSERANDRAVRMNGVPPRTAGLEHAVPPEPTAIPNLPRTTREDRVAHEGRLRATGVAAAIVALLLVVAAVRMAVSAKPSRPPASSAVRFLVTPPDGVTLLSGGVISPDAHWLVYVGADSSGQSMLMVRALDEIDAKPLAGTKGASAPFWSPDSQFIGFFGDNDLRKVNVSGETAVQTLVTSFPARGGGRGGGTWSQNGVIVYAPSRVTELYSVSADGGTPHAVTALIPGGRETAHQWPQFLPDGRRFLYTALGRRPQDGGVYVGSLDSPERTLLFRSAVRTVFAPPGYVLFARDGSLIPPAVTSTTHREQWPRYRIRPT
jgi:eukaryotic-like serine/threonine-protein kinase